MNTAQRTNSEVRGARSKWWYMRPQRNTCPQIMKKIHNWNAHARRRRATESRARLGNVAKDIGAGRPGEDPSEANEPNDVVRFVAELLKRHGEALYAGFVREERKRQQELEERSQPPGTAINTRTTDGKGRPNGLDFVRFPSHEEAVEAVTRVNGRVVMARPWYVALARGEGETLRESLKNKGGPNASEGSGTSDLAARTAIILKVFRAGVAPGAARPPQKPGGDVALPVSGASEDRGDLAAIIDDRGRDLDYKDY